LTVVFLACLCAILSGARAGFAPAAALLGIGAAIGATIPKRRLEVDYRMGYAGLAAAALMIANVPAGALLLTGYQMGGMARDLAGPGARSAFALAWLGLGSGSLGYWGLAHYVSPEHAPLAVGAVGSAAGSALWFRMARSRRWRALSVAVALLAVAVLLVRVRQADRNVQASASWSNAAPEPPIWLLPVVAIAGTLVLLIRKPCPPGADRLLTYLGLSSVAVGMVSGASGQGTLPLFSESAELSGFYLSGSSGLVCLGAAVGAAFWTRFDRPNRWALWLLGSAGAIAIIAAIGPSLLLLDVMLGWPAPWPWLIALVFGGWLLGPIPAAGFSRLASPDLAPWACAIIIWMAAAGHQGATAMAVLVGASQTAAMAAALLLICMLLAGSWNRLQPS
jgi:hypothetical protein